MLRTQLAWVIFSILGLFIAPAQAELFKNSYLSFELPSHWKCTLDNTEWICRSPDQGINKQAVIILTAKEAGPEDELRIYQNHLKTSRSTALKKGSVMQSRVIHAKTVLISGSQWVDGFHSGSEVPTYLTRYLATIKNGIAILVSFSAHQLQYSRYANEFNTAVMSLKVIADKSLMDTRRNAEQGQPIGTLGSSADLSQVSEPGTEAGYNDMNKKKGPFSSTNLLLILVAVGIIGFLFKDKFIKK